MVEIWGVRVVGIGVGGMLVDGCIGRHSAV